MKRIATALFLICSSSLVFAFVDPLNFKDTTAQRDKVISHIVLYCQYYGVESSFWEPPLSERRQCERAELQAFKHLMNADRDILRRALNENLAVRGCEGGYAGCERISYRSILRDYSNHKENPQVKW